MQELDISEVFRAREVLKEVANETRIIGPTKLADYCQVYLKPENMQLTGSFKLRGAYYKISQLSEEEKSRGVIACSAGNHAQGVALGATHNGIKSVICLPAGAPLSKIEATKGYGAEVCLVPGVYDDAYRRAIELRDEKGYTFVHPFDDPLVIAGQGTIGVEIIEQMKDVDAVVVPIGGGGLISGVAFAIKTLRPDIKIYGVQAEGAPSMKKALECGERGCLEKVRSIADGVSVKEPGSLTFEMVKQYVDEVVTVSDNEIAAAILALLEKQKMVAEGAGAVSVAAVMFHKLPVDGKKVCCIVSGGNIDVNFLNRVITRGLAKSGRLASIVLDLPDTPGALSGVVNVIAELGGNILSVTHERTTTSTQVNGCLLHIEMETRNNDHIKAIKKGLIDRGYHIIDDCGQ